MNEIYKVPIRPVITGSPHAKAAAEQKVKAGSFKDILNTAIKENGQKSLTISKHAMERAALRGIELDGENIERIARAADKAAEKGITDTLIFMDNTAFIVNVPSKVVITVVGAESDTESIFTNINGAVIV